MDAVKRILKFGLGGAFGAAMGAGIASLFAPQKGQDLQKTSRAFVEEARTEGASAQAATETALTERFRQQVKDQNALTGAQKPEHA